MSPEQKEARRQEAIKSLEKSRNNETSGPTPYPGDTGPQRIVLDLPEKYIRLQPVEGIGLGGFVQLGTFGSNGDLMACFFNADSGVAGVAYGLIERNLAIELEFCRQHDGKEGLSDSVLTWFEHQHDIFSFALAHMQKHKLDNDMPLDTPLHRHIEVELNLQRPALVAAPDISF